MRRSIISLISYPFFPPSVTSLDKKSTMLVGNGVWLLTFWFNVALMGRGKVKPYKSA